MAERKVINGWIVERRDDGTLVPIAPVGGGQGQPPADPGFQYEGPKAQADMRKAQADAATAAQMNEAQLARARADAEKAKSDAVKAAKDAGTQPKNAADIADLRAEAVQKIALARSLAYRSKNGWFNTGVGSGVAGSFSGTPAYDVARDTETLRNAGALQRIMELTGSSGGRNPLFPLSNSDFQALASSIANLDTGQSDEQYQRNLKVIEDIYGRAYRNAGGTAIDADVANFSKHAGYQGAQDNAIPAFTPPAVLPRADGAHADSGLETNGVAGVGGIEQIPELAGIDQQVADAIGRGASSQQIISFLNDAYAPHKIMVGPDLAAFIGDVVEKHSASPSAPVRSLATGWDILSARRDSQSSLLGAAADTNLGNFAMTAANAATAGLPAYMAGEKGNAVMAAAAQERPKTSLAGEFAGSLAAMTGINKAAGVLGRGGGVLAKAGKLLTRGGGLGGDVLYGTTRGGLENGPTGALVGALAAGVGNKVGQSLAGVPGAALRGIRDPRVNLLAQRGVNMTPGQLSGNRGMFGKTVNAMESAPLLGPLMASRRADSLEDFAKAGFREAGEPIGFTPRNTGFAGTEQGLSAAGRAIEDSVAGVDVPVDQQAIADIHAALAAGRSLPDDLAASFKKAVDNRVVPALDTGRLTGKDYQQIRRGLRAYKAEKPKPGFEGDYRDALSAVEDALTGNINRESGPEVVSNLGKANEAYRNFKLLEDATKRAQTGSQSGTAEIFTPAQLQAAVKASKYTKTGTKAPFYDLAKAGQEILPSTLPNSGTTDRALVNMALPTLLGGGSVAASQYADPRVAGVLGVLALLSTKSGAKYAQKAMVGRSPAARALGRKLLNQRRKTGLFGSATASAMVPDLSQ